MRNLFTLLVLVLTLSIYAQDDITILRKGGSFKGLDKQGDTLTALRTVDYVMELGDDVFGILSLAVETDSVSGISAYSSYLFQSLNGEDWGIAIDTIIHSGGGDSYNEFDAVNGSRTFYKVSTVATSATQKSNVKIWGRLNEGFVIEN